MPMASLTTCRYCCALQILLNTLQSLDCLLILIHMLSSAHSCHCSTLSSTQFSLTQQLIYYLSESASALASEELTAVRRLSTADVSGMFYVNKSLLNIFKAGGLESITKGSQSDMLSRVLITDEQGLKWPLEIRFYAHHHNRSVDTLLPLSDALSTACCPHFGWLSGSLSSS